MSEMSEKWGEVVADRGFTQVPNYLLQMNLFVDAESKVSATEMVVLLQLVGAWWKKDEMPYPSMATLAKRAGMSERQVQRSIKELEAKGLLKRARKTLSGVISSNSYDLTPLVEVLQAIGRTFPPEYPRAKLRAPSEGSSRRSLTTKEQVLRRIAKVEAKERLSNEDLTASSIKS